MAIEANDIKLNSDRDLDFSAGDFSITESSVEHLESIVESSTNDYKINPIIGVNMQSYLNGPLNLATFDLKRIIKSNMEIDGFDTTNLKVTGDLSADRLNIVTSGKRIR